MLICHCLRYASLQIHNKGEFWFRQVLLFSFFNRLLNLHENETNLHSLTNIKPGSNSN